MKRTLVIALGLIMMVAAAGGGLAWANAGSQDTEDSGKIINSSVGDEFVIALDSNLSTGYQWEAKCDASLLSLVREEYVPDEETGFVGAGGTQHFTFKALEECDTEITFTYKRSWETGYAEQTTFRVTVTENAEVTLSTAELLENPVYGTEVKVHGNVSALRELFCPCFGLTSGGATLTVWYDLMVQDDGTQRPAVSVEGIENGDKVIVTGELRMDGNFWASHIRKMEPVEPVMVKVRAPVENVEIVIAESWPPQYFLRVVSGLPNSCAKFDSYDVTRSGDMIRVEVTNLEPAHGSIACAEIYRSIEHTIPLGTDFVSGRTYTVVVNDVSETFVAQ